LVAGAAPATPSNGPGDLFKNQLGKSTSLGFAWDPFKTGDVHPRQLPDRVRPHHTFVIASTILPNLPGGAFAPFNTDFGQGGAALPSGRAHPRRRLRPCFVRRRPFPPQNTVISQPEDAAHSSCGRSSAREVARNTTVSVSYIGRRAYHLLGRTT